MKKHLQNFSLGRFARLALSLCLFMVMTVGAVWAQTKTVYFYVDQGTLVPNDDFPYTEPIYPGVYSYSIESGSVVLLPSATREGYTFDGWSLSENGSVIGGYLNVSSNFYLYARFTQNSGVSTTEPSITVATSTINFDEEYHNGTLDITFENLNIDMNSNWPEIQFYDETGAEIFRPGWILYFEVTPQDPYTGAGYVISYNIDENTGTESRTAYFKVYARDAQFNNVYSNLVTIIQEAPAPITATPRINYLENYDDYTYVWINYGNISFTNAPEVRFFEADGTTPATYSWLSAELWSYNDYESCNITVNSNPGPARTAYLRVYVLDENDNWAYSNLVTINQESADCPAPGNLTMEEGSLSFNGATFTWTGYPGNQNYDVYIGEADVTTILDADFDVTIEDYSPYYLYHLISNNFSFTPIPYGYISSYNTDAGSTASVEYEDLWVEADPVVISFKAKITSDEANKGSFWIDGVKKLELSGNSDWTEYSYEISDHGYHTLEWKYVRENDNEGGYYSFYLDDIRIKEYSSNSMSYVTTTTDPTYTFNNLDPETTYMVNVESYCGSDGYSQTSNTVLFTTASQCQNPDHVTATDVTPTSAHISWYSYGHTEAVVEYSMDPYFSGGYDIYSVIVNDADSVTLTGLTPNSWYGVRVKTYCDDDNDPSTDPMEIVSETIEIVTPCDYIPIPYFEDFENYSSNLSCWTLYDNITTSDYQECPTQYRQYTKTVTEYYPEQNEYLEFRSHNNTDNPNIPCEYGYDDLYAVLPPAHDVNTLRIRMMAKLGGDTWVFPLSIGVMTDPNDLSTYQGVGFINIESHMNYAEYTFDFANYTGTGEYIALRMPYAKTDSNHVRILCVDNLTVEYSSAVQYTVDVMANPAVGGTVTGGGTYNEGDQVTVTAVAAEGYVFEYWSSDWSSGSMMSTLPSYTFTVDQNITLVASFREAYTVYFDAGTGNCETASLTETNDGIILPVATTTCEGWTFAGWATTPVDETMGIVTRYEAGNHYYPTSNTNLYAVYSNQSEVEGYFKTTHIEYGDEVCLVHEENILSHTHNIGGQEFAGISNTYPPRGIGQEYDRLPQGVYVYTVEVGSRGNGFVAFKHGNSYLNWRHDPTSLMDNHLNEEDSLSENTSWIVSFDNNGNANIVNDASYLAANVEAHDDFHAIRWDYVNSRFTCYLSAVDEGYDPVQLYKHGTATIGLYNSNPCMVTCEEISVLPYTRDFEENVPAGTPTPKTRILPQCVTIAHEYVTLSDTTKPQLYYGHTNTGSGNYSMYLCGRGIYALPQYMVEDQEGRPVRMSFYLTQTKCKHQLQVGVMTDLSDESSFTPVVTLDNGCSSEIQYCDFELAANNAALNGKYIAFKNIINPAYTSESRSYNWIDDLEIKFGEPQAVTVCEINHTYTENFEDITTNTSASTGIQPECWRKAGAVTGMTTTDPQVSYNSNGNGSYNLYMSGKSIIVMPEYVDDDVALNTLEMSLKVRQKKFAHELEVGVMTDPTDESTFELVAVINNGNTTTLLPCAVDFTTYEGTGRYIAFRNTVKSGYTSTYSYNWIDDISFSVKQAEVCGIEIRYEEDFDDMTTQTSNLTGEQPQCWTLASGTELASNVLPQLACNSAYAGSGSYSLYLSGKCIYVMPEILTNVNVSELRMSLTVRQRKFSHQLEVGVMTDPTDVSTFELVKVINNGDYTQPKANEVDFSEYTGQGKYIAFRNTIISGYTSTYSYNWIDDIVIDLATNFPTATTETMVEAVETEDAELDSNEDNNEEPFNAPNAINSFSVEQLSLYPNPTSGKLTIVADEVSMVEVYSQIGSKVATFTLNNEHVIDLGNLPKGVYILRVTMPEGVAVRKVVKN